MVFQTTRQAKRGILTNKKGLTGNYLNNNKCFNLNIIKQLKNEKTMELIFNSSNGIYNLLYTIELAVSKGFQIGNFEMSIDNPILCEMAESAERYINKTLERGLMFGCTEHGDYFIADIDSDIWS